MGISSLIGPAVGLIGSAIGGGGSKPSTNTAGGQANYYQPTGQGAADQQLQGMFNNYSNPYGAASGYNSSYLTNTQTNPYASGYQGAAGQAGAQAGGLGAQQIGSAQSGMTDLSGLQGAIQGNPYLAQLFAGAQQGGAAQGQVGQNSLNASYALPGQAQGALGGLQGLASSYANPLQGYAGMSAQQLPGLAQSAIQGIQPYAQQSANTLMQGGNQVLQSSMDPQNALYAQQFQQNQDQTRAGLAARGLDTSGTGAGIENQSDQNFNTNWQNQQLARQQSGLSSYQSAVGQGLGGLTSGANTTYNLPASALGQGLGALNTSANTGYGLQSGAAGQYLSGLQSAYGAADALGNSGASSIMAGAAAPSNAYNNNVNTYLNQMTGIAGAQNSYAGLGATGLNNTLSSGQLPYATSTGILGDQNTGISNYLGNATSGQNMNNQMMSQLLSYLGYGGTQAGGLTSAQDSAFTQNQTGVNNIGSALGSVYGGYQNNTGLGGAIGSYLGGYNPTSYNSAVFNPTMTF